MMNRDNLGGPGLIGLVSHSRKFEFDPGATGKPLEGLRGDEVCSSLCLNINAVRRVNYRGKYGAERAAKKLLQSLEEMVAAGTGSIVVRW